MDFPKESRTLMFIVVSVLAPAFALMQFVGGKDLQEFTAPYAHKIGLVFAPYLYYLLAAAVCVVIFIIAVDRENRRRDPEYVLRNPIHKPTLILTLIAFVMALLLLAYLIIDPLGSTEALMPLLIGR